MYAHDWHKNFRRKCTKSESLMKLKRHNKNGEKYNISEDFRGGERCLYRRHDVRKHDGDSDVSSDVSVSLHELPFEVKNLYITRKVFLMIRN